MALAQNALQMQSVYNMEPNLQIPGTGLARGVHITEYKETRINPNPLVFEESDLLMEQYLSPSKLQSTDHDFQTENLTERLITGIENLEEVESLELKVNTEETSLGNFGSLLPNLHQLKLSDSVIPRIRDLGSSLRNVHVMWMSRCGLSELDGISSMSSLKEVYLSYNDIADISPLSMLDTLQILDLEGNNIDDIAQIQYLSLCQNLKSLALEGNPVCVMSSPDSQEVSYNYRSAVKKILPHLRILDDEALIEGHKPKVKPNAFDDDWAYLQELQKDALMMEESIESIDAADAVDSSSPKSPENSRPPSAALRPATSYRPGCSLRPKSAFRPLSANRRPATVAATRVISDVRPMTANRPFSSDAVDLDIDPVSDLTAGIVICGNPSRALRSRKKPRNSEGDGEHIKTRLFAEKTCEEDINEQLEHDHHLADVVQELKDWRIHHEKRMQKIMESKAPQVLVIDENTRLSDSESENDDEDLFPGSFSRQDCLTEQTVNKNFNTTAQHPSVKLKSFKHDESFELDDDEEVGGDDVCRKASPPKKTTSRSPGYIIQPLLPRSNMKTPSELVTTATGLAKPVFKMASPPEIPFPPRPTTAGAGLAFLNSARMRRQHADVHALPPRPPVRKS